MVRLECGAEHRRAGNEAVEQGREPGEDRPDSGGYQCVERGDGEQGGVQ